MALWSLLGARAVDVLAWESFSSDWATDVVKQLKIADARVLGAPYGELPDLTQVDFGHDVVSLGTARPRACASRTPISFRRTATV